jgi:hypothetical protein
VPRWFGWLLMGSSNIHRDAVPQNIPKLAKKAKGCSPQRACLPHPVGHLHRCLFRARRTSNTVAPLSPVESVETILSISSDRVIAGTVEQNPMPFFPYESCCPEGCATVPLPPPCRWLTSSLQRSAEQSSSRLSAFVSPQAITISEPSIKVITNAHHFPLSLAALPVGGGGRLYLFWMLPRQ